MPQVGPVFMPALPPTAPVAAGLFHVNLLDSCCCKGEVSQWVMMFVIIVEG